ncbi:MAG: DUF6580 family putative transport protein [Bacteriovoracia bacterium]
MNKNLKSDRNTLAVVWVIFGTLARLIPHAPNMTPTTSIALFSGSQLGRVLSFVVSFLTLIASDLLLAKITGYPAFGVWSFFTYSGFAAIIVAGFWLKANPSALRTGSYLVASSLGFWLWTNFGIWITGDHGLYARTFEGLVACYVAALPFLGNALAGDLIWGSVFFLSFYGVRRLAPRFGISVQNT